MKTLLHTVLLGIVLGVWFVPASAFTAQSRRQTTQERVDPMTGSIKGQVTASDTGAAVRGAEVRLSSRGSYSRLATTDADGSLIRLVVPDANVVVER